MISIRSMGIVAAFSSVMASTPTFAAAPADSSLPSGCGIVGYGTGSGSASASDEPAFPPVQLEIRTPFEPTGFHGGGYDYLIYELHLQSFSKEPLTLRGLEVSDAGSTTNKPIAALNGPQFYEQLLSIGTDRIDEEHPLRAGQRAVVFICLAFDSSVVVPDRLRHRIFMDDAVADGPVIGTRHTLLKVLAPPVTGADWIADAGPGTRSHHRTGLFVAGGLAQISDLIDRYRSKAADGNWRTLAREFPIGDLTVSFDEAPSTANQ